MSRLRRLAAGLGSLALIAGVAGALGAGSAAAAAESTPDPAGVNLEVTVVPGNGSAPASPSPTTAPPASSTTTTIGGVTVVSGPVSSPVLEDDEYSLGGILYVSGLRTEYHPALDPLQGDLVLRFTVRNVSGSVIDSTARFWVTGPFGGELSSAEEVPVSGLKPDEKVVVATTLPGVGQWLFGTAHYTLTPPAEVEGVALEPLTRDTIVFLPPWFLLGVAALCGVGYVFVRVVRARYPRAEVSAPAGQGSPA
ncbi:hypothetical protein N1031_00705 [Herbiconiux moechotypicola]|uniref:DUF916 domain-containing protein n=1 Tax=Herbiconiux moechotypicola TaxID=637393 RepID=A0ABN3D8F0_9MICO|nr:hypothetical protein [Herbiconiux moechotypicola]MCS5728271.1 hypothetical protein [Herbiconiux moechotypicola]